MATFQKFTDIEAWQKARKLTFEIYEVTKRSTFSRDFELRGQIRDASVSVMSNIARASIETVPRSLFISFRLQKVLPLRLSRSFTLPSIRNTSQKKNSRDCLLWQRKLAVKSAR